ncbi:hypothetical protein HL666_14870 [Bradyrhizobium sp. 83002]|uniref:hypothetical protein n=1 Tax=Bradyrhizobium aeschynomenes TaxID=2734909 RepID=UPI001551F9DE|nr:hypothetical protein [Bradyrhizobium aeschynomenes]NPU12052.1 hypothetical protein [Bradyrhizobium aeschynomenes]
MSDVPTVQVTLNPNAVKSAAQLAAAESNEAVSLFLSSLETADLSQSPAPPQNFMNYRLTAAYTAEQRRNAFRTWIVAKGIGELVRGLRQTLEEAYLFSYGLKELPGRTTADELEKRIGEIKRRANNANFPQLITAVQSQLTSAMSFEKEILSLVAVRNCLEHRHGIVSSKDADANGQLSLTLPRLQAFTIVDGNEVEVGPGFVAGEGGAAISLRRVNRERIYQINDKIELDATEFQEVAFACHLFAEDVVSKLPVI